MKELWIQGMAMCGRKGKSTQISCGYASATILRDHILRYFRTPPDISSFGIFSLIFQVGSVNGRKWMHITYYYLLQARKVETHCVYLLSAQTVSERMNR